MIFFFFFSCENTLFPKEKRKEGRLLTTITL